MGHSYSSRSQTYSPENQHYSRHGEGIRRQDTQGYTAKSTGLSDDLKKSLENAQTQYLRTTESLLKNKPNAAALHTHLAFLRKSRNSYHYQSKRIKNDKQKQESVDAVIKSIDDAIVRVSHYMVEQLAEMGITGGAAYAYGPREGVHYDVHTPGRDHFQLALPLVHGRLVRQMGDLMCKSSREFWGLRITDDPRRISCWACLKWMLKMFESKDRKKNRK